MGTMAEFWAEAEKAAHKSKREFEETQAKIDELPGWRFAGVEDGWLWQARHRGKHGAVHAKSARELVEQVLELVRADEAEAKRKSEEREKQQRAAVFGFRTVAR